MIEVLYFAWLRERAGTARERVETQAPTVAALVEELRGRSEGHALALSDLQAVERDFAFVVGPEVEALALVNAAAGADKALIAGVSVFDQFQGLEGGQKSLAITVRLQPRDKTLTDADIEAVSRKIVEKVEKATGGRLRA